jgi:hypothetical protein
MKTTIIINIFILFHVFSIYGQEYNNSINIKIKRTYSKGKITNEDYYNRQGQLIKTAIPNYSYYEGEALNGEFYSISYEYDTLASVYEYSEHSPQKKRYSYHVKDTQKSALKLTDEYYLKNGLLVEQKQYYGLEPRSTYYWYNEQGDSVKNKTEYENIYFIDYIYTSDSLVQEETKYKNNRRKLVYRLEYEYNAFKQKEESYYYNYDNKLTKITLYSYDEKQRLIKIEETGLDIYTVAHQRRDKKYITSYKYNDYNLVIEEHIFDDFMDKKGKEQIYQYEYEYY